MASAPQQNQDVVCETCGMSYEEFKKVGKLDAPTVTKHMATDWFRCLEDFMEIYNTMESFRPEPLEVLKFPEKLRN